jgi:hypothetical protein
MSNRIVSVILEVGAYLGFGICNLGFKVFLPPDHLRGRLEVLGRFFLERDG